MSPRADVSMTDDEIDVFLSEPRNAVLSTLSADGSPHLSGMWFARAGDELRMWTYRKSQKAVNARRDPRVAVLIEDGLRYDELRGVMIRGELRVVDDTADVAAIGALLYERYVQPPTGVPVDEGPSAGLLAQAPKRVGLILTMEHVASWDHSKLG